MTEMNGDLPLYALFQIGNSIHQFNRRAEKHLGLSLVQWYLLMKLIDLPAASPFALAAAVGVHPSTLTQTLKRLEKKEFIYVGEDPHDSRKKVVSITRAGKIALDRATEKMESWSKDLNPFRKDLQRIKICLATQVEKI